MCASMHLVVNGVRKVRGVAIIIQGATVNSLEVHIKKAPTIVFSGWCSLLLCRYE